MHKLLFTLHWSYRFEKVSLCAHHELCTLYIGFTWVLTCGFRKQWLCDSNIYATHPFIFAWHIVFLMSLLLFCPLSYRYSVYKSNHPLSSCSAPICIICFHFPVHMKSCIHCFFLHCVWYCKVRDTKNKPQKDVLCTELLWIFAYIHILLLLFIRWHVDTYTIDIWHTHTHPPTIPSLPHTKVDKDNELPGLVKATQQRLWPCVLHTSGNSWASTKLTPGNGLGIHSSTCVCLATIYGVAPKVQPVPWWNMAQWVMLSLSKLNQVPNLLFCLGMDWVPISPLVYSW